MLKALLSLSELFLPSFCLICGRRIKLKLLCTACTPKIDPYNSSNRCRRCYTFNLELDLSGDCLVCSHIPSPLDFQYYLWSYQGEAKALISAIKYLPSFKLAQIAAENFTNYFSSFPQLAEFDCVVPIPHSKNNRLTRPFNFSALLAHKLHIQLGGKLKFHPFALHRNRCGQPQASLRADWEERYRATKDSLSATKIVRDQRVLLVDDVVTTGATIQDASRALFDAGAASVSAISLARSLMWEECRLAHYH